MTCPSTGERRESRSLPTHGRLCCCVLAAVLLGTGSPCVCMQVQEIEAVQVLEARRELQLWDERYQLRTKPLTELRAMAQ